MTTAAPPTASTDVDLSGVTVRFASRRVRTTALDGVSLRVGRGEFVTVVGPSGCGKSTLLKVVAGLIRPSGGEVSLLGRPVTGPRDDVGFVFQRAALLDWRGVRRNILLQAEMRGMDRAAIGLGSVFTRLRAQMNWHDLFHELIKNFDPASIAERQASTLAAVDLQPAN